MAQGIHNGAGNEVKADQNMIVGESEGVTGRVESAIEIMRRYHIEVATRRLRRVRTLESVSDKQ